MQAEKERQLQAVTSRTGAYKGGFALPPTAVRQIFAPFDPDDEDDDDDDDDENSDHKGGHNGSSGMNGSGAGKRGSESFTPRWVRIARSPPEQRSLEDVVYLAKLLKRLELTFLAECGFHAILEVARAVRLETFFQNQRVFMEGDAGEKLYVIVSGSVSVWKVLPPPKGGAAATAAANAKGVPPPRQRVPGATNLAQMHEGTVFGEISLLVRVFCVWTTRLEQTFVISLSRAY